MATKFEERNPKRETMLMTVAWFRYLGRWVFGFRYSELV